MADRLGVRGYPVDVTPVSGEALQDLQARLKTMEAEVKHLAKAVGDMQNAIATKNSRLLTSGVMNSRNWALSVAMSHCYVQALLGANPGKQTGDMYLIARFQLYTLFHAAAKMGFDDGVATRRRLNVRPTDVSAQIDWDGVIR